MAGKEREAGWTCRGCLCAPGRLCLSPFGPRDEKWWAGWVIASWTGVHAACTDFQISLLCSCFDHHIKLLWLIWVWQFSQLCFVLICEFALTLGFLKSCERKTEASSYIALLCVVWFSVNVNRAFTRLSFLWKGSEYYSHFRESIFHHCCHRTFF